MYILEKHYHDIVCFLGIRRFIKEMEEDGRVYEMYRRSQSLSGPFSDDRTDQMDLLSEGDGKDTIHNYIIIHFYIQIGFHAETC